jgi:hypothetical protein
MDSPLYLNTSLSRFSLSDANDAPPQLNGTVGGASKYVSFLQGTRAWQ